MKLSHKAKKNFEEDNQFYIDLGKKLRAARKTKVNEFTGKETLVTQTRVAQVLKSTFQQVGKYEKELSDLNVFIARKNDLEGELEETKTELLRERKKHEQIISELERKTVKEKERLRKEMEAKIKQAQGHHKTLPSLPRATQPCRRGPRCHEEGLMEVAAGGALPWSPRGADQGCCEGGS